MPDHDAGGNTERLPVRYVDRGRFRALVKFRGVTVAELAEQSGVHESTITRYLSGQLDGSRSPEKVRAIADALAVDVGSITAERMSRDRPRDDPSLKRPSAALQFEAFQQMLKRNVDGVVLTQEAADKVATLLRRYQTERT